MAVNAQFFSAAFFYISFLKDANTSHNTAATIQPNPFWFWENIYIYVCMYLSTLFTANFIYIGAGKKSQGKT